MGANKPERCRLAAMICATLRPVAGSRVATATNSGMAIGTGWTLPWVTSSLSTASARRAEAASIPIAAPVPSRINRRRVGECRPMSPTLPFISFSCLRSLAEHVLRVEIDLDVFPLLIVLGFEHLEGLTSQDRALGTFGHRGTKRRGGSRHKIRGPRHRAIGMELNAQNDLHFARGFDPGRRAPALLHSSPKCIQFALGKL